MSYFPIDARDALCSIHIHVFYKTIFDIVCSKKRGEKRRKCNPQGIGAVFLTFVPFAASITLTLTSSVPIPTLFFFFPFAVRAPFCGETALLFVLLVKRKRMREEKEEGGKKNCKIAKR